MDGTLDTSIHRHSLLLWLLTAAFAARVTGQALVAFLDVGWLPPMAEWYSGLLAYPLLLPAQLAILTLMVALNRGVDTGRGPLATLGVRPTRLITGFALVYLVAMVARYVITMTYWPERRWTTGTIPIFFHWLLALYLLVLGHHHRNRGTGPRA